MKRKLGLEALESRRLLAGNVIAVYDAGELRITTTTNDPYHNWIEIRQENPGAQVPSYEIRGGAYNGAIGVDANGRPLAGTTPTTINGQSSVSIAAPSGKLYISLGKGNDVILIAPDSVVSASDITVYGGPNRDYLEANQVTATGKAIFSLGLDGEDDVDTVKLSATTFGGDAVIRTGGGNDAITAAGIAANNLLVESSAGNDMIVATGVSVHSEVNISTWTGNDTIRLGSSAGASEADSLITFGGPGVDSFEATNLTIDGLWPDYPAAATVVLGAEEVDADTVQLTNVDVPNQGATIRTGGGADFIFAQDCDVEGDLLIESGDGDDVITALDLAILGLATVRLGGGNDRLDVSNSSFASVSIDGNAGNDRIDLADVTATTATISLYTGDDTINLVRNVVVGSVWLYGGPGFDTLSFGPGLSIGDFAGNGFENPQF